MSNRNIISFDNLSLQEFDTETDLIPLLTPEDEEEMNKEEMNEELMKNEKQMTEDTGSKIMVKNEDIEVDVKWNETQWEVWQWKYITYNAEDVKNTSGTKILFFHASWCSSCKAADKQLKSEIIPEWLSIFNLDYDSNIELRKEYWVTSQHTFVQIDDNWNLIKRWFWSRSV